MPKLNYTITAFYNTSSASRGVRLVVVSNFVGTAFARIYLDGGATPAFTAMSDLSGAKIYSVLSLAQGTYRVDFQDNNGILYLGKFIVYDSPSDTCYPEFSLSSLGSLFVSLDDSKIQVITNIGTWLSHTTAQGQVAGAHKISIDGGVTYKDSIYDSGSSMLARAIWTNAEIASLGLTLSVPSVKIKRNSNACIDTTAFEINLLNVPVLDPLTATYSKTNCTAAGSNDGTVTVFPDGGSGSYSYLWNDAVTTQNRSGLSPGTYSVVITDITTLETVTLSPIQITEPSIIVSNNGSILEIPMLNSIQFVVDPIDDPDNLQTFQTFDNTLFCHQYFTGFGKAEYFQKVMKGDAPITQFNSDFSSHLIELKEYETGNVVKTFSAVLKQTNIGITEDFSISIRNHDIPGQSRIYFNVGTIPIPLSVGDAFEILNNLEGFNGTYTIVAIILDATLGYQYVLINKNYVAAGSSSLGTGRFDVSTTDFNVYEFVANLLDVASGKYYLKIKAFDNDTNFKVGISEPFDLQLFHKDTLLITYRNIDNACDITWVTGYIGNIRVPATLFERNPGADISTSRDSDYSLVLNSSRMIRGATLKTYMIPAYLHEKISVVTKLDFWFINKVQFQTDQGYGKPAYIDRGKLSNSMIDIEQVPWFKRHNSDDIGSIAEGGFLLTGTGFLKI